MKHEDLQYLLVDLPGDIRRLKDAGEFSHMRRVIEMRLSGEKLTEPMRKRLELELAMTQMLDAAYPYSAEEAAALAAGSIRDFTPAELEHYRDLDAADWIYVDAQVRYRQNFLTNLIKTRPELEARVLDEKRLNDQHSNRDMLEKMMAKMREKGGAAVKFRIRASVQVKPEAYRPGKKIRVQIPVPVEGSQMKDVRILKISPEPAHVAAPDYPQRTVCFEGVYPQETVFQVEYEYVNRMRYVKPDPARVSASQPRFYTEELPPHIVFKPYIRMLASQIVGQETNPLIKARKIYDYVTTVPTYSFMPPYFCVDGSARLHGHPAEGRLRRVLAFVHHPLPRGGSAGPVAERSVYHAHGNRLPRLVPVLRGPLWLDVRGRLLRQQCPSQRQRSPQGFLFRKSGPLPHGGGHGIPA